MSAFKGEIVGISGDPDFKPFSHGNEVIVALKSFLSARRALIEACKGDETLIRDGNVNAALRHFLIPLPDSDFMKKGGLSDI
jgi:hypothetical protein